MRLNKCDSNIKKKIIDIDANDSKYHRLYIICITLYIIIYYIIYNQIKYLVTVRSLRGL